MVSAKLPDALILIDPAAHGPFGPVIQSGRELKLDALLVLNCLWQERRCTNTEVVLQYLATHKRIARRDVSELCKISPNQSRSLISKLLKSGKIVQRGHKRGSFYEIPA